MTWRNARWAILTTGVLLNALVVLLPSTRWIVVTHLCMAWNPGAYESLIDKESRLFWVQMGEFSPGVQNRLEQFAQMHPDDFPTQLGWKLVSHPDSLRLRQLMSQFGNQPVLLAAILRYDCMKASFWRMEEHLLTGELFPTAPVPNVPSTMLEEMEKVIRRAEEVDPDNAFFTMMRSAVLFASLRDREAIDALFEASRKRCWDDYALDGAQFSYDLLNEALGKHSVALYLMLQMHVFFAHHSAIRFCANMATYTAMQMEKWGNVHEGIDVRLALLRCGRLMRLYNRSSPPAWAAALVSGRAMLLPQYDLRYEYWERDLESRVGLDLFTHFLRSAGREADARWVEAEFHESQQAGALWKQVIETRRHPYVRFSIALARAWITSIFLLTGLLAVCILWGMYTLVGTTRLQRGLFVAWSGAVAVLGIGMALWFSAWWRSAGMFLAFARAFMEWLPAHEGAAGVLAQWLVSALSNLSLATGSEVTALLLAYRVAYTSGVVLLLLFITGAFALTAVVTGRGSAEAITLGWHRYGPVLAGVLMTLYALSVLHTAQVEVHQERELRALRQYGPRYILQQMGWRGKGWKM